MEKDRILELLRQHESELQQSGVEHLYLFGSVARGETTSNSDVDLLAEFRPNEVITLVRLGSLEAKLEELVGAPVELSSAAWMRPAVRQSAEREAILAF